MESTKFDRKILPPKGKSSQIVKNPCKQSASRKRRATASSKIYQPPPKKLKL